MRRNLIVILLVIISTLFAVANWKIIVDKSECVGCSDCVKVCPVDAIQIIDGKAIINVEECISCEICVKSCTYDAILKVK
ncbi:MAG: 4Fe-4S binding protein [Candidatus Cloacimonetes bacterium]|jgi:Fe-S-cluster-containing hydrogenase component 2|nr:4Fe-4S binding protein [Candidatus Cloacimonadota bacterium]MBT6993730.1 4Fe-4S binding protein [Candidatus Cloacimonadota bacterium]MBT7469772.1 4Fe-4S binding protein [Candidatus Cloacimonadota bacterium]